jgi:hypothetical protein
VEIEPACEAADAHGCQEGGSHGEVAFDQELAGMDLPDPGRQPVILEADLPRGHPGRRRATPAQQDVWAEDVLQLGELLLRPSLACLGDLFQAGSRRLLRGHPLGRPFMPKLLGRR